MVRGAKGRALRQHAFGQGAVRRRVDAGHREGFVLRERQEQPGQALGQHGLARPGRADHEEMVTAPSGDLDGSPAELLTAHVGEIGRFRRARGSGRRGCRGPVGLTTQDPHQIGERGRAPRLRAAHERGHPHVADGPDEAEGRSGIGQGRSCPGRGAERR